MGGQGDHCSRFKRVRVNPILYKISSFSDYSASQVVGKKTASYITAESSYLILGNKLGVGGNYFGLRFHSWQSWGTGKGIGLSAHLARCACKDSPFNDPQQFCSTSPSSINAIYSLCSEPFGSLLKRGIYSIIEVMRQAWSRKTWAWILALTSSVTLGMFVNLSVVSICFSLKWEWQ